MKTIATLGEDGVMDLSAEPESAYAEARKNKDLAHAIQALVEMRDDWHCWMTKGLKGLNPEQDVYVLATIVYLAGVRQAVPQILVVRGVYREALAGEEWIGHFSVPEMALHRCLDAVEKLSQGGILVRSEDGEDMARPVVKFPLKYGEMQFNSELPWEIPKLELS